ncbi:hypothetical protein DPMN_018257 [Dreissena polymorpha]|uniref:Uncharacterized protein n=1 Tax=Dreissena polymorpha TaxID=45954 RepID=A0A9D4NI24_DREPO|nr:hypothetical protein DPMN_018257 [Dreissena polymorpha]
MHLGEQMTDMISNTVKLPRPSRCLKVYSFPVYQKLKAKSQPILVAPYHPSFARDCKYSTNLNCSSWLKSVSLVTVPLIRPDTISARVNRGTKNMLLLSAQTIPFGHLRQPK